MKLSGLSLIVCAASLVFAQKSTTPSSPAPAPGGSAPGAYSQGSGAYRPEPADRPPLDVLASDPQFLAKMQKLLGEGTTPQQACDGFKKLIDCVSAIHASLNLNIPIPALKEKMTGKSAENLEKAIHDLKPDLDAKAEKKKAQKQAERDIPAS